MNSTANTVQASFESGGHMPRVQVRMLLGRACRSNCITIYNNPVQPWGLKEVSESPG